MATRRKAKRKAKTKRKKTRATKTAARRKTAAPKMARKTAASRKKTARKATTKRASAKKARPAAPVAAKSAPPKSPAAAAPAPAAPARGAPREERIGVVTHYFNHLSVATVRLESGHLHVGDTIHIRGHTTDFTQRVDSLEVEHAAMTEVGPNDDFGLKVVEHAREHDVVYKVQP